jgi:hypothetical protein
MVYLPGRSRGCGCFVVLLSSLFRVAISSNVISWVPRVATMLFFVARGGGNSFIVALYVGARRAKRRIPYPPPKTD